jgi:hypothetical protein
MQRINPLESYQTSVTLRKTSVRRVKAAILILSRHRFNFSEQRIFSWLLKFYLNHWRGQGRKPACLRRYNTDGYKYQIRPLYINQVLHAAATQRAMHSGESVSRMLDFAIRVYLPRLLEEVLTGSLPLRCASDKQYWQARYARRLNTAPVFISYRSSTEINTERGLHWLQKTEIIPKSGLSPWQILEVMQFAA